MVKICRIPYIPLIIYLTYLYFLLCSLDDAMSCGYFEANVWISTHFLFIYVLMQAEIDVR
jgi:hypothetical protein